MDAIWTNPRNHKKLVEIKEEEEEEEGEEKEEDEVDEENMPQKCLRPKSSQMITSSKSTRQNQVIEEISIPLKVKEEPKKRKRKNNHFRKLKKAGMKDQKKMEKINEKADKREEEASIALASIGNPWDNVSFDDKKRFGLFYYFESV